VLSVTTLLPEPAELLQRLLRGRYGYGVDVAEATTAGTATGPGSSPIPDSSQVRGPGRRVAGPPVTGGSNDGGDAPGSGRLAGTGPLTHVEYVPPRRGDRVPWPDWVPAELRAALAARGVSGPWRHQALAADAAWRGEHVIVATGTASGKSLAYQLPALARLLTGERATVLYLAPTKVLAADQLRVARELDLPGVRPASYDGDTPREEREWVRHHARFVLTNPDMVHHNLLPGHTAWATFLRRLCFVVVDECHAYRGVFGSHVAHVLRRLRRVAARYGARPVFVLASATVADPADTATRLLGLPVTAVTDDGSPRGGVTFALWEPPLLPPTGRTGPTRRGGVAGDGAAESPADDAAVTGDVARSAVSRDETAAARTSALRETAYLLADAVAHGVRTLAFVRSRRGAELVASVARRRLDEASDGLGRRVAAYRAGYLREERRALEHGLLSGELRGLAATSALELGVDLVGLDAVLLAGYPGTLASLWQQAGRAGRAGRDSLCVLVARDDPLDTYLVHHPDALFGKPVEASVLDPANPYVLAPQLACAAAELPLTEADLELFGQQPARAAVASLVASGVLRQRPTGWYWTARRRPDLDLRGTGGAPISVVETATGRLLGTVDRGSSHLVVHTGALYLHQGASYVVDELDLDDGVALVHRDEPDWTTVPREVSSLSVASVRSYVDAGPVGLFLGPVEVTSQVVDYQRRHVSTGDVIDTRPLDLPPRSLHTVAVWWTVSGNALASTGMDATDLPGALHAAEHGAIGLLPLVATCDRWDIGGLSTPSHPDTQAPSVFVYDGHPGGAGFAERAFEVASQWLGATRSLIARCGCQSGCPSCVQSPKCGNGNSPLDKPGSVQVLDVVLHALAAARG
jgi:DEAD/DEAH box helicase domain-containing protein